MIGGFIILFSVIISILNNANIISTISIPFNAFFRLFNLPHSLSKPFVSGIIELTNGISNIASIHYKSISINIILSSFLLGFGGLSVFLQVWGIISKTDISIIPYFLGKTLQGLFSIIYTIIIIHTFPIFNLNL